MWVSNPYRGIHRGVGLAVMEMTIVRFKVFSFTTLPLVIAIGGFPCASGWGYPGGPLRDVTDDAPYCAGCHSSVDTYQLRELPAEDAQKRTAAVAHLAAIRTGTGNYAKLSPEQRSLLIADIKTVDANSKITIEVPQKVRPSQKFAVTVNAQGGSGPVLGITLLDTDLRDQARPVSAEGFQVAGAPQVIGPDGKPQEQWLSRRYDGLARNLSFVVIFGVTADLAAKRFSTVRATYALIAPSKPGRYTICAVLFYGTEKASLLGRVQEHGHTMPLGGFDAGSGRILFTSLKSIEVQ